MRFLLLPLLYLSLIVICDDPTTPTPNPQSQTNEILVNSSSDTEIRVAEPTLNIQSDKIAKKIVKLRKLTSLSKLPKKTKLNQLKLIQNLDDLREQLSSDNHKMSIHDLQKKEREVNGWVKKQMGEFEQWRKKARKRMLYIAKDHEKQWHDNDTQRRMDSEQLYQTMLLNEIKKRNMLRKMLELQVTIQRFLFQFIAEIKNRISLTMSINMTTSMLDFITKRQARYYRVEKDKEYYESMKKLEEGYNSGFKYDQNLITVA